MVRHSVRHRHLEPPFRKPSIHTVVRIAILSPSFWTTLEEHDRPAISDGSISPAQHAQLCALYVDLDNARCLSRGDQIVERPKRNSDHSCRRIQPLFFCCADRTEARAIQPHREIDHSHTLPHGGVEHGHTGKQLPERSRLLGDRFNRDQPDTATVGDHFCQYRSDVRTYVDEQLISNGHASHQESTAACLRHARDVLGEHRRRHPSSLDAGSSAEQCPPQPCWNQSPQQNIPKPRSIALSHTETLLQTSEVETRGHSNVVLEPRSSRRVASCSRGSAERSLRHAPPARHLDAQAR
jgi:hypothetical protein